VKEVMGVFELMSNFPSTSLMLLVLLFVLIVANGNALLEPDSLTIPVM
jgi:hypothetical protein